MTAISNRCLVCVVVTLAVLSHVWCLDITEHVFGDKTNYLPAAFGDFNSDKLTDLFVVTEDGKTVKVLISHNEPPLMHANSQEMPNCTYKSLNIRSVVPGDFDGNGEMDVMIVSLNKDVSPLYQIFILWGNLDNMTLDCSKEDVPLLSLSGQPLVMDYNGDMIPDLFGANENHTRMFWVFSSHRNPPQPVLMTKDTILPHLKRPSSHGFVDMNNDLAADLWVTAEGQFEVWKKTGDGYVLDKVINPSEYMKRVGQTSFADVNLDGHIDALVPACKDDNCKQSAVFVRDYESDLWVDVEVSFVDQSGNTWSYLTEVNSKFRYSDTITLHVGDFNLDGFPDFLVTLFNKDKARVTLMENAPCEDAKCRYKRKFLPHWNLFGEFNDTVLGTFCDFEEDGTLDVLLVRKGGNDKYHLNVYKDATEYDAVFVKVLIPTGRCYGSDCERHNIPYGTNQPGPSITYTITTATGGTQRSHATQLPQTAHHALHLPYTVFGLGRNWNFVEQMTVGIPKARNNSATLTGTFTQIIPNSQLVVIPYPMSYPDKWVSKLFITPSKAMLMTAGALVGTCVFVAAIIGILHRREMQQDKREKQQDAHKFHFDAIDELVVVINVYPRSFIHILHPLPQPHSLQQTELSPQYIGYPFELALSPEECSPAVMFTRYFIPILDGHSPAANPEMDLEDALRGLESTMLSFPVMLEEVVSSPQRAMVEQDPRYAKTTLPGMPGGEPIHRGFSKGAWSPFGVAENGRCILCLVTRDHRLILCGCVGRHWVVLANLAEEWYRYNASQAWKRTNLPPSSPSHLHYAARITLLGVSQVLWTPVYEDQRGRYSMLITLMGKGCVIFWQIETNFRSMRQASIFSVCDSNMTNISAAHWDSLSDKCGYLIVGNSSGQIKIFFCQFNSSDVYFKKLGFIWESTDMLSVHHIHMTHVDAWQYLVIFSKHNIVMASSVSLSEASLSVSHTSHTFIGDLEVSGIVPFENHNIYVSSKDGLVRHIRLHVTEDGDTAIEEREVVFSSDDVLYSGMASSPNSTLIAVFEMIKVAYDHLVEREPTLVNIYRLGDAAKLTQSLFESPKDVHQNADIFESLRISICKTGHCPINFLQPSEIEDQPLSVLKVHYWLTKIARSCGIADDEILGTLSEVETMLQKAILENSILKTLRFCEGDQPKAGSVVQSLDVICDWIRRNDPANAAMAEKKLKKFGGFKELCPVCKKEVPLDFLTHGRCSGGHTLPRCCWSLLLTEPNIICPRCRVYCHEDSDFLNGMKGEYCCTYCDGFMRKQLVGRK